MSKYVYKIRRKSDGLYSTGGQTPDFTRNGKTWSSLGMLKTHLRQFEQYDYHNKNKAYWWQLPKSYNNCEVVKIEVAETPSTCVDLKSFMASEMPQSTYRS